MKTNILIYEDTPKYDLWLKLILGGVLALTFILGIIFIYQDTGAAVAMYGITLFDALLLRIIRLVKIGGGSNGYALAYGDSTASLPH